MQGIKIPTGAAVPDVTVKKTNHITPKIKAFSNKIVLLSDIKLLMVLDYASNMSVANLSNLPSGHKNCLVGIPSISTWQM